jgi:hypothetical protein
MWGISSCFTPHWPILASRSLTGRSELAKSARRPARIRNPALRETPWGTFKADDSAPNLSPLRISL